MILTHWLLQWGVSSFMTPHWNCGLKLVPRQKIQLGILVLIKHVKNLVHHYAMCYQLFMPLQGATIQRHLKRKGKVSPFKLLEKRIETREVFTEVSTEISLNSSILERVEKYLCLLYGKKTCNSIDDVRLQMFLEKYSSSAKKIAKMRQFWK